jgi:hypothetical protein
MFIGDKPDDFDDLLNSPAIVRCPPFRVFPFLGRQQGG